MSEAAVATKSRQPVVVAANAQLAVEPDNLITVDRLHRKGRMTEVDFWWPIFEGAIIVTVVLAFVGVFVGIAVDVWKDRG